MTEARLTSESLDNESPETAGISSSSAKLLETVSRQAKKSVIPSPLKSPATGSLYLSGRVPLPK